ncbi:MAG TPA: APC family permease [Chloroflexota bacterium]|nr:APC family permease [Chloroflexota bacterium]
MSATGARGSQADIGAQQFDVAKRDDVHKLHPKAVGLAGVLFLTVTGSAPITAMLLNTPYAVGNGNGLGAPASFLVATIILVVFSVGYAAMARKVTAVGGFYAFISHGLSRELGMGMGFASMIAYSAIESSLAGAFSYFLNLKLIELFNVNIAWPILGLIMVLLVSLCTFFDVKVSTRVLGVALVAEVVILAIFDIGVFAHVGSGANVQWSAVNPINAFQGFSAHAKLLAGAAGIGLFFAFWSWVGFEMAPNYGEESRDPKRIVPLSLYISVIGLGVLYTLTSWASVSGYLHVDDAIRQAQTNSAQYFYDPATRLIGKWVQEVMSYLILTGSFACALSFHNTASRYFYALGRERVLPSPLGRTHPIYKSPYVASIVQSVITVIIVLLFVIIAGSDNPTQQAYYDLYGLMALLATLVVMVAQAVVCIAIIAYFERYHASEAHWWKTRLAPAAACVAQAVVIYLLLSNLDFLSGGLGFAHWIPVIAAIAFLIGLGGALYFKQTDPAKYELIGRMIYTGADTSPVIEEAVFHSYESGEGLAKS